MLERYLLSPQMADFVAASEAFAAADHSLAAQRAAYRALCAAFSPPRPAGRYLPDRPVPASGWPGLLYLHGGGWMLGDLDSHGFICAYLVAQLGVLVLALDYRLAPEQPFPAALDDCRQVWHALQAGQLEVAVSAWPRTVCLCCLSPVPGWCMAACAGWGGWLKWIGCAGDWATGWRVNWDAERTVWLR